MKDGSNGKSYQDVLFFDFTYSVSNKFNIIIIL